MYTKHETNEYFYALPVWEIRDSDDIFICCVVGTENADALLSHLNKGN